MNTAATRLVDDTATDTPLRFVSAASLFDGHDAAINIIRRILQSHGAEVIHLGHNRSVADIVRAAIEEDADGIAVSSYQGGHNEYFRYMVDMLRQLGAEHIRVVVGGGGTIAPQEVEELEAYGVEKIYTPDDGLRLGLDGMIDDVFKRVRAWSRPAFALAPLSPADPQQIARTISVLEAGDDPALIAEIRQASAKTLNRPPVIGITGTGGAGKSSLTDELLSRLVRFFPERKVAVVAMDPTRRRSGGALLGDRIRMNALANEQVFMRSLATRRAAPRHQRGAGRHHPAAQVGGLRPHRGRDRRHRPERHRDRRHGRLVALRDDQRIRRGQPAREDRHARLRRPDRAQQVREARRRGRAARRAQAGRPQPQAVPAASGAAAGVPDHRQPVQRCRRERTVCGGLCSA
jgi:methylmalonyl-CoA mutase cobalamin-binding domain/chain